MKNRHSAVLILITCIFAAFTLGFLAGRNTTRGDVILSSLPDTEKAGASLSIVQETAPHSTIEATDSAEEQEPETTAVPTETSGSGLININTASVALLDTLPGIGPVLAQRIIDYREAHGPFTSLSQLMLVEGIGEKRLADILDLITIE